MAEELKRGDRVRWKSHGGTAEGHVVRKISKPTNMKGHHVAASPDNPEFIVETDSGKRAAHRRQALKKS